MKKPLVAACALLALLAVPRPAHAWGFVAHRLIMERAIDILPPSIKPFFEHFRSELTLRVVDPDLWRNVGWEDDPNHFLDFGAPEYGAFPFAALPRDYSAALEKFGPVTLKRNGLLPWRTAELYGYLRRGYEEFTRRSPYATSNVVLYASVVSHYIQDAHQPLHATDNYDGAATGNRGVHARFERDLVERFQSRLRLSPAAPVPMLNPRDATFDVLLNSHRLVDELIAADKSASAGKDTYDDAYYETFFTRARPMLEQQLSAAISATAGLLVGAWEQAGRPALATTDARPVQRVRP